MHRFFIPPAWITPSAVCLQGTIARQIKTVLRMQVGDELVVLDNSGMAWRVEITGLGKDVVDARIIERQPAQGEPNLRITLYQGTLKGQKFEWVLQKGTELGVSCFVPTICERSVVNKVDALRQKYLRWQEIIREAAEQSRRGRLPALSPPVFLLDAVQQVQTDSLLLMPWEEASGPTLRSVLTQVKADDVAVFIGPEGGFSEAEAALARAAGGQLVSLGPRILRAETAGLAVCAAILYELGEWE